MLNSDSFLVFIAHDIADQAIASGLAQQLLAKEGIRCWLPAHELLPGDPWQERLEAALEASKVVLVLVPEKGFAGWHNEQLRAALDLRVLTEGRQRVIPVLLSGAGPETISGLPSFLRRLMPFDLSGGVTDDRISALASAIRGIVPSLDAGPPKSGSPPSDLIPSRHRELLAPVEAAIRSARQWVRSIQNSDSGLPSDGRDSYSCTWTTAGLLWALWEGGESYHDLWMRRALTWVLDNVNEDAGIPIVARGDVSVTDATAQTVLATTACAREVGGDRYETAIRSLVQWLVEHQETRAGWSWRPGFEFSWTTSTAFALLALNASQFIEGWTNHDVPEAIETGSQWLLSMQNPDGGWGSYPGDESRAAVTGLTTYMLTQLGHQYEYAATLAIDYLRLHQLANGGWASTIERPARHTVTRFGDAYGLLGLASCIEDITDPVIARGTEVLMKSFKGPYFQYVDSVMHTWPTRDALLALTTLARRHGSVAVRPAKWS